jgi:hypothetical protein
VSAEKYALSSAYVASYQPALPALLSYPMYFTLAGAIVCLSSRIYKETHRKVARRRVWARRQHERDPKPPAGIRTALQSMPVSFVLIANQTHTLQDPTVLGAFLDNHDQPRFPSYQSDPIRYRAGLAYVLLSQAIPIVRPWWWSDVVVLTETQVYYGAEQMFKGAADPDNRYSCR